MSRLSELAQKRTVTGYLTTSPTFLRVLSYVAKVETVTAWPDEIDDKTIRHLRARGYLDSWETGGLQMAQTTFGGGQPRDALSEKGKAALAASRKRYKPLQRWSR